MVFGGMLGYHVAFTELVNKKVNLSLCLIKYHSMKTSGRVK
jgi:hypothetical protein